MKIAVLFGGISPERNVSIAGGRAVVDALRSKGHDVLAIDPAYGADGLRNGEELATISQIPDEEMLAGFSPRRLIECVNSPLFDDVDVAFLVLHGKWGEDGTIQSLLKMRGIPFTGSQVKASSLAMDKISSKMMFLSAGIPTPQWATLRKEYIDDYDILEELRSEIGPEMVIKPNDQGSTIGITIIRDGNLDDINEGIRKAFKYSDRALAEKFIEGRELTVSVVGDTVLPVIEIIPEEGYYDYEHKYTKGKTEYVCPAEITDDVTEFIQGMADTAYNVLGCEGFGRVDFRLDEEGQPFCLEVNTIPGFTATSLVPMASRTAGTEFPELCEKIINLALNKNDNQE
ncbi:MAG: D-alanine--D-alanine ligase [Candidatus Kapaibacterium sp.]